MKQLIENLIKKSIETINPDNTVNVDNIRIDRTKDRAHGDFATNIAMLLAKPLKQAPRQIAQSIIDNLPKDEHISKVEIAGPGFINFFINKSSIADALEQMIVIGHGARRMSSRELKLEVESLTKMKKEEFERKQEKSRNYLLEDIQNYKEDE